MIEFLLNDKLHQIEDVSPNLTVLNYLRNQAHKTGTKEGCASGDCGACTVVIAELIDGQISYQSINSCIALVGSLHGKQLITVEDLVGQKELHPVQQAMVDCHGSQCGFCTPGFVMSMMALRKNIDQPSREDIEEYLSGNLCRCTGYQPILNAAKQACENKSVDSFAVNEAHTASQLLAIKAQDLNSAETKFYNPISEDEFASLVDNNPTARILAGGTDLVLEVTQSLKEFDMVIATASVKELKAIKEYGTCFDIGAGVSYSEFFELLNAEYPEFADLMLRLGSRQIRNSATFGGNIANASPIGDTPPALIALGASIQLRKGKQVRSLLLEDFFLDYKKTAMLEGEYISRILIPKLAAGEHFKVLKISKRLDDDISAVAAAFWICLDGDKIKDCRLAYGGMAATPKRAAQAEQRLIGQQWSEETIRNAMDALEEDFQPLTDVRASAAYRLTVSKNLLLKAYIELSEGKENTRVLSHG